MAAISMMVLLLALWWSGMDFWRGFAVFGAVFVTEFISGVVKAAVKA